MIRSPARTLKRDTFPLGNQRVGVLISLLARSYAALAISVLTAGVITIAPAGVAAASRDGASAFPAFNSFNDTFGTTEQQPTSLVRGPKRAPRGAAARAPKPDQTGTFVPFD